MPDTRGPILVTMLVFAFVFAGTYGLQQRMWQSDDVSSTSSREPACEAARLHLGDGTRIAASASASLELELDGRPRIRLATGQLWIERAARERLEVHQGDYVVQAGRAAFTIRDGVAMPIIEVTRGRVELRGPGLPAQGLSFEAR